MVFPKDEVNLLDIVISEENWEIMLEDMDKLYGEYNTRKGMVEDSETDRVFVESQVFFNDIQWYNIGVRFKSKSSLRSTWQSCIGKLPFKLDFDEFEDNYPEIEDQRFYGISFLETNKVLGYTYISRN